MISVLVVVLAMHFVAAKPLDEVQAQTNFYENFSDGFGNYRYAYQTSNGIEQEQTGQLITTPEENVEIVVKDKNGYRPIVSIKSSVPITIATNSDANRHSEPDPGSDKHSNSTILTGEVQKLQNNSSLPCLSSSVDKSSTASTPVQKETSTTDPTIPCTTGTNTTFDERLGKAVMISILGRGG